ncbi:helicase domain protein [Nitzschia inconspicua]|uniref:Helicase domain protein n=1 Tax=Nitzschia inconspicua TaxID=303405 RepID=A0A9K3KQ01_9STRA|nr:helicase domain protein [Nitzschia inconspicua]
MTLLDQLFMQQSQRRPSLSRCNDMPLPFSHQQLLNGSGSVPPKAEYSSLQQQFALHNSSPTLGSLSRPNHNMIRPGRYQEVSNMRSDILDTVDNGIFLVQPLDFDSHNQYTELLEEAKEGDHPSFIYEGDDDATDEKSPVSIQSRFRHYQADKWTTMLEELIQYRRQFGHCNVPHTSKDFPELGRWVKRQRYQYKLMQEGKKESTMTPARAQTLEQVGFVWDAHSSTWHRRYQELTAFCLEHGHCNVPSNFPPNPQLSTWVKFQRRQYKALQKVGRHREERGAASGHSLTPVRIQALEQLGFQWELRRITKKDKII